MPRREVLEDGTLGETNGVTLTGLNHKMGYRGTVNTALSFGADAPAVGTIVGEPHQGLRYMFHMMNEARTAVGLGATMVGYAGYQVSLHYARDRRQGRHPDQRDPTKPPVAIVEHADVRRMLLTQKCLVEGGLMLGMYCARLIDDLATLDNDEHERVDDLLQILTPIAKAWPSQHGPRANDLAIQVLGGAGYTRDWPVERYYRDNRLNPIHEGTNGVQCLDLLGRKVTMHQGRALTVLLTEIGRSIALHQGPGELDELCDALRTASELVATTTQRLGAAALQGEVRRFLANATEYLDLLGNVVVGLDVARTGISRTSTAPHRIRRDARILRGQATHRPVLHPLRAVPDRALRTPATRRTHVDHARRWILRPITGFPIGLHSQVLATDVRCSPDRKPAVLGHRLDPRGTLEHPVSRRKRVLIEFTDLDPTGDRAIGADAAVKAHRCTLHDMHVRTAHEGNRQLHGDPGRTHPHPRRSRPNRRDARERDPSAWDRNRRGPRRGLRHSAVPCRWVRS